MPFALDPVDHGRVDNEHLARQQITNFEIITSLSFFQNGLTVPGEKHASNPVFKGVTTFCV